MKLDCRLSKWLRGLLPLALVTALAMIGVREHMERDLTKRTAAILQEKNLSWAIAKFSGRDAILEGLSFSNPERDAALLTIKDVWGVRAVIDKSELIASPETYNWWARKDEQKIKIRGHVPTDNDRRNILGFVKAAMPDLEVDTQMKLAGGSPPRQAWVGFVSFALLQLGQLKSGTAQLAGADLVITGEAKTTEAYRAVKSSISAQLPAGMTLKRGNISPPVVKPYGLRVKYTGSTISLTGHAPSEAVHDQILRRTRNLFPGIKVEDAMELASGAPDGWLWAVTASLTQLYRLESGRVRLKDLVLEFEGIAADKNTAKNVTASIRNGLPASYRLDEKVSVRDKPESKQAPAN